MINPRKLLSKLFIVALIVLDSACLNRQFIEGRVELISISDTTLNDSSVILGHVYPLDWSDNYPYKDNEFEIWLEDSNIKTTTDTNGYYSLITEPGLFAIKCQRVSNDWERLIEEMKDIEVPKNKKYILDFYIGYTIE